MATDFNKNAASTKGGFKPNSADTPLDARCRVETEADILKIPRPFIGMVVYVVDTGKRFEVLTLKDLKSGMTTIKNGAVDTYREIVVSYNDLVDKPEIDPQSYVSELDRAYWNSKFDMPATGINESHLSEGLQNKLDRFVSKEEGKSLVDDAEIERLAKVDNYDDSELRKIVDEEKPYLAAVAAYPTSKFLFACGQPMTVEPNVGHKYDAEKPEDAVAFVYRWSEGFKAIVVEKEEAAKIYLVGGYGHENIGARRSIPQTNMIVRDVKIKGLVGGSYFEGMVGHVNIEAENCEFVSIMGAGWCGASVNGQATRMNVVDDINIKMTNCKISSTFFGGPQGNGVADDIYAEFNNCEIGWLTAGGSNGMTRNAKIVVNGGSVKVVQSTNRGIVYKARFILNDGVVNKLYFGGETEDTTVNGIIEDGFVELNGGVVKNFIAGTDNGVEIIPEVIKGSIMDCIVENGDINMLEKIEKEVEFDAKAYVDEQIAAIEHPEYDDSEVRALIDNKADKSEIIEKPNFQFEVEMVENGVDPVIEQVGEYPNIKFIFKLPLCFPVATSGKLWFGYIPYDETGEYGFCEPDHVNENMTYDIIRFGIEDGGLRERESDDPSMLGKFELRNVPDLAYVCVIMPAESGLVAYMDDGIGGKCTFADFDRESGFAQDGCVLINEIDGIQYKLYGFYVTTGGGNFTGYIDEVNIYRR